MDVLDVFHQLFAVIRLVTALIAFEVSDFAVDGTDVGPVARRGFGAKFARWTFQPFKLPHSIAAFGRSFLLLDSLSQHNR